MEEFIENFTTFRHWLYQISKNNTLNDSEQKLLNDIINKFEELELNDAF